MYKFCRMNRRQGYLPLNRGGGFDARTNALRRAAAAITSEMSRRYDGGNSTTRQRSDQALHFKEFERDVRYNSKVRDDNGRLIMYNNGRDRYCDTCSEATSIFKPNLSAVHHRHEDSAAWRCSVPNSSGKYPCHTCKVSYHSYDIAAFNCRWTGGRLPVLATSSTLFNWQGARHRTRYDGDPFHIERISVAGATVRNIAHAIDVAYFNLGKPIDLLICAGINDIIRGHSAIEIMCDLVMLEEALETRLPTSTMAICTLPLPPMICQLPGDLSWRPASFVNRLDTLIELNLRIVRHNQRNSRRLQRPTDTAPTFHTRGLRTRYRSSRNQFGPRNLLGSVLGHRHNNWRESNPHNMLHLNETIVCSMGRATVSYFSAFYGLIPRTPRFNPRMRSSGTRRVRSSDGNVHYEHLDNDNGMETDHHEQPPSDGLSEAVKTLKI